MRDMKGVEEANRAADAVGPPTPDAALSNVPSRTAQNGPSRSVIPARSWTQRLCRVHTELRQILTSCLFKAKPLSWNIMFRSQSMNIISFY